MYFKEAMLVVEYINRYKGQVQVEDKVLSYAYVATALRRHVNKTNSTRALSYIRTLNSTLVKHTLHA